MEPGKKENEPNLAWEDLIPGAQQDSHMQAVQTGGKEIDDNLIMDDASLDARQETEEQILESDQGDHKPPLAQQNSLLNEKQKVKPDGKQTDTETIASNAPQEILEEVQEQPLGLDEKQIETFLNGLQQTGEEVDDRQVLEKNLQRLLAKGTIARIRPWLPMILAALATLSLFAVWWWGIRHLTTDAELIVLETKLAQVQTSIPKGTPVLPTLTEPLNMQPSLLDIRATLEAVVTIIAIPKRETEITPFSPITTEFTFEGHVYQTDTQETITAAVVQLIVGQDCDRAADIEPAPVDDKGLFTIRYPPSFYEISQSTMCLEVVYPDQAWRTTDIHWHDSILAEKHIEENMVKVSLTSTPSAGESYYGEINFFGAQMLTISGRVSLAGTDQPVVGLDEIFWAKHNEQNLWAEIDSARIDENGQFTFQTTTGTTQLAVGLPTGWKLIPNQQLGEPESDPGNGMDWWPLANEVVPGGAYTLDIDVQFVHTFTGSLILEGADMPEEVEIQVCLWEPESDKSCADLGEVIARQVFESPSKIAPINFTIPYTTNVVNGVYDLAVTEPGAPFAPSLRGFYVNNTQNLEVKVGPYTYREAFFAGPFPINLDDTFAVLEGEDWDYTTSQTHVIAIGQDDEAAQWLVWLPEGVYEIAIGIPGYGRTAEARYDLYPSDPQGNRQGETPLESTDGVTTVDQCDFLQGVNSEDIAGEYELTEGWYVLRTEAVNAHMSCSGDYQFRLAVWWVEFREIGSE